MGRWGLLAGLLLATATQVGGCSSPTTPTPAPAGYQIHVLEHAWHLEDGQSEASISAVLADESLNHDALTIGADDITEYDWREQSILLTTEATATLGAACGEYWWPDCRHRYFIATLDGRRLYGGAFWDRFSALATPFPVIYLGGRLDGVALEVQPGWTTRVDLPEIHDYFKKLGKLKEPAPAAT